jgi:phosphohistidine phosphatase
MIEAMLRLMLLRHAKSSWDEPGVVDRDRPLSARGRRAAALMAMEIVSRDLLPDRILCSPARRTRETLAALVPHLADETRIAITGELYEPSSGDYLRVIGSRCADAKRLMVIGHNPAIQATAISLADEADPTYPEIIEKLPAGALVVLDFSAAGWADAKPGSGKIAVFLRPRDLEKEGGFETLEADD